MGEPLVLHKGRTNILPVSLGVDVSQDTITSEIRTEIDPTSDLIATWQVEFLTDGSDGECVFTIDDSNFTNVTNRYGWMDVKRVSDGEPLPGWLRAVPVYIEGVVTA